MKNEISKIIAEYLGSVMTYNNSLTRIQFERACVNGAAEFIKQEASNIAEKILPILPGHTGSCSKCSNEGLLLHYCPYLEWKHLDEETACNCCEDCKQRCRDKIL